MTKTRDDLLHSIAREVGLNIGLNSDELRKSDLNAILVDLNEEKAVEASAVYSHNAPDKSEFRARVGEAVGFEYDEETPDPRPYSKTELEQVLRAIENSS